MATYAVGDVQGCYDALMQMLELVQFDASRDRIWFAGDLVNRGPDSLRVLRLVHELGERAVTVLGNHDLHLLAVAAGARAPTRKDSLDAILEAPDRDLLLDWLRRRPLAWREDGLPFLMVHAGVPPQWSVSDTLARAAEVQAVLRAPDYRDFLAHMYGDSPDCWSDDLGGHERLRVITNYLTRMRFCDAAGRLDLETKSAPSGAIARFAPWFSHPERRAAATPILFCPWASLEGKTDSSEVFALDTGCVWGGRLRAMRLEDGALYHCSC